MIEECGRIELRAQQVDGMLVVSIHDNGPGVEALPPDPLSSSEGVGLRNTRERLKMLYGDGDRLSLEQSPLGGLIAKIRVPFHTSRDLRTSLVEVPA
jgi:sensor histidine kinase YesM